MDDPAKTLITNANLVLDGFPDLQKSFAVLIAGNRIASVSKTPLVRAGARVIDVGAAP